MTLPSITLIAAFAGLSGCAGKIGAPEYLRRVQSCTGHRPGNDHSTLDRLEEVDSENHVLIEVSLRSGEVLWGDASSRSAVLGERSMPGIVAEMSRAVDAAVGHLASSLQDRIASSPVSRGGTN